MKKIILHAVFLSIIGLIVGWFLWPFEMTFLINSCRGVDPNVKFVTNTMDGQFLLNVKNAISWFVLPVLALLTYWVIVRFKKAEWSLKTFYKILGFVWLGYLFFMALYIMVLLYSVKNAAMFSISVNIKNDFSIDSLSFHKWAMWGAVIGGGLYFLLTKKAKS